MRRLFLATAFLLPIAGPALANGSKRVTELDNIPNLFAVCSAKQELSAYTGPLYQIERDSDLATMDVYPGPDGWPNSAAIAAFAQYSDGPTILMVPTCYDQTGNGRTLNQTDTNKMPYVNMDGAHPVFAFEGYAAYWSASTGLLGWLNGVAGGSVMATRQYDTIAGKTANLMQASINTSGSPRAILNYYGSKMAVGGLTLDSDTTVHRSAGFVADAAWHLETVRWDYVNGNMYHSLDGQSETLSAFEAGSSTSATNSKTLTVGANSTGAANFHGKLGMIAFVQGTSALPISSDLDLDYATKLLPTTEIVSTPPNQFPIWPATVSPIGTYTMAPNVSTYLVQSPDGATPSLSDLQSMRYNHHTRVAVEPSSGRIFVAHSTVGVNEDDGGIFSVVNSTVDNFTHEIVNVAVPNQSTFYPAGGGSTDATVRETYPRDFEVANGKLYLISDVVAGASIGLIAVQCNADGSVGAPFVINPDGYTSNNGFPSYSYDPVLGPPLLKLSTLYGTWAGTGSQFTTLPLSVWTGATRANGSNNWAEPATVTLASGKMLRFWRKGGNSGQYQTWLQISSDGGTTWGAMVRTAMPNAPSAEDAIILSNGHLAVITNNFNTAGSGRDPLDIAIYDGTTGVQLAIYSVAQSLPQTATYPGNAKNGGPTYSGAWESSLPNGVDTLYVSYSWHSKENVNLAAIPVAGL